MPREEFDAWLADEAEAQEAAPRGSARRPPRRLREVPRTRRDIGPHCAATSCSTTRRRSKQVVRNGRNRMPPVGKDWEERQMEALTDYLQEELLGG